MSGFADITNTQKAWRKIQQGVAQGFNFECEEVGMLDNLVKEDMPYSFRENSIIADLNEEGGIASIGEGDYEAEEGSVGLEEFSPTIQHLNGRFNLSNLAHYADKGMENQLEPDLKLRAAKKVQALSAHVSDAFYGSASGVLALTDTAIPAGATTAVLSLRAAYANTALNDPAYVTRLFKAQDTTGRSGDTIALVNGGTMVANSYARVTSKDPVAGTLTVAFIGNVAAVSTVGLKVVKANSLGRAGIQHTDFGRGLTGMHDMLFGASLHGLSHQNWTLAYSDNTASRFSGEKLHRADDELQNQGGEKAEKVIIDQGVERDLINNYKTAVRFTDGPFGLEIDGSVKSKGRTFYSSRRVPAGWVVPMSKTAIKKWQILPMPGNKVSWGDGKEYINQSGMVFRVETVLGLVCQKRKGITVFTNQTRI